MAQVTFLKIASQDAAREPPAQWSYSAAKTFGECPKRWLLSRIKLSHFGGSLPRQLTKAALEGTLLHELLKKYSHDSVDFKPRKQLKLLLEEQKERYCTNSRVKIRQLIQKVSLDKILHHFHQFYPRIAALPPRSGDARKGERQYGSEVFVEDSSSRLFGIIDYVDAEGLTDFKTGLESGNHITQVLLYGALWLARWGVPPKRLSVTYAGGSVFIDFTAELLVQVLAEWRETLRNYDFQIREGKAAARPSCDQCRRCHVRGLCKDYWSQIYPKIMQETQTGYSDYMPSADAVFEKNVYGYYIRDRLNGQESTLLVDVAESLTLKPSDLRILGVQIKQGEKRLQLIINENSEIIIHYPDV